MTLEDNEVTFHSNNLSNRKGVKLNGRRTTNRTTNRTTTRNGGIFEKLVRSIIYEYTDDLQDPGNTLSFGEPEKDLECITNNEKNNRNC